MKVGDYVVFKPEVPRRWAYAPDHHGCLFVVSSIEPDYDDVPRPSVVAMCPVCCLRLLQNNGGCTWRIFDPDDVEVVCLP